MSLPLCVMWEHRGHKSRTHYILISCHSSSPLLFLSFVPRHHVLSPPQVGSSLAKLEQSAYAAAGAVAEEVISSIRTVVAFGGEGKEGNRCGWEGGGRERGGGGGRKEGRREGGWGEEGREGGGRE